MESGRVKVYRGNIGTVARRVIAPDGVSYKL